MKCLTRTLTAAITLTGALCASGNALAVTEIYTSRAAFEARVDEINAAGIQMPLEKQSFEEAIAGSDTVQRTGPAYKNYDGLPLTASAAGFGVFRNDFAGTGGQPTDGSFALGYQGNGTANEPLVIEMPVPVSAVGFDIVGFGSTDVDPFDICAPPPYALTFTGAGLTDHVVDVEVADGNLDPANTQFFGVIDLDSPFMQVELTNSGYFVGEACGLFGDEPNEGDTISVDALEFAAATFAPLCGDVNNNAQVDDGDVDSLRQVLAGLAPELAAPDNCSVFGGASACNITTAVVLSRHLADPGALPGLQDTCVALNRAPVDFAADLKAYWSFDEAGGTALNRSPQGLMLNAVPEGDANRVAGRLGGGALSLPGTAAEEFLEVAGAVGEAKLTATDVLSISAWVRPTGPGGSPSFGGSILSKAGEYELFRLPAGNIRWQRIAAGDVIEFGTSSATVPLNEWTHLVMVFDSSEARLYTNGLLTDSWSITPAFGDLLPDNNRLHIGGSASVSGREYQGDIDDMAIWTRVLPASEIAFLYSGGFGREAFSQKVTGGNFDIVGAGNQWGETQTAPSPANLTTDWADFGDFVPQLNGAYVSREAGVLIASVRENGPAGGQNLRVPTVYPTTIDNTDALAIHISDMQGGAEEANARISLAWFPFAEGWIGGHVSSTGQLQIGSGITQANVQRTGTGRYTVSIPGVTDARASGLLFAIDANNTSDNVVSTNPAGASWTVLAYDNDQNFGSGQDINWSFVYIPYASTNLVAAELDQSQVAFASAGMSGVVEMAPGITEITIPGEHYRKGVMLLGAGFTPNHPQDNLYTYAPVGGGRFESYSYDLPAEPLQRAQYSFAYISFVKPPQPVN